MIAPIVRGDRPLDYKLKRAILIYESGYTDSYATLNDISDAGTIGAGVPLGTAALRTALGGLRASGGIGGWLASSVLYIDQERIVWHSPARVRPMFFKSAGALKNRHGPTPHPGLVFAVSHHDWHVVAVTDLRPGPGCAVHHAPYFNVFADGRICTGNVQLPKHLTPEHLEQFEDAFFRSHFTVSNHKDITTHPEGPHALWGELLDAKHKTTFPTHYLSPTKRTLAQFVAALSKGDK